ncbi:hypothetical protein [Polaromonas sp.]|uniref:hypothetical protein n=1 Tax=Polaromonas sp. TaxID=1869339 RepID=UPI002FC59A92
MSARATVQGVCLSGAPTDGRLRLDGDFSTSDIVAHVRTTLGGGLTDRKAQRRQRHFLKMNFDCFNHKRRL